MGFCGSISLFSTKESFYTFAVTGYRKLEFGELSQELQFSIFSGGTCQNPVSKSVFKLKYALAYVKIYYSYYIYILEM